jgi:hypothetical protein
VLALLAAKDAGVAEIDQGVEVAVGNGPDAGALAAVAAVRPTQGNVFLAAKRGAAVAAVAGENFDARFVKEFHEFLQARNAKALSSR